MSGYLRGGLGQHDPDGILAEICSTGHCDYYTWGQEACVAAWGVVNAAGGQAAYCAAPARLLTPAPWPHDPSIILEEASPVYHPPPSLPPEPVAAYVATPHPAPPPPPTPGPMGCPIEYPRGHWDAYGQLICERPFGLEPIAVPVAYGAQRVEIPRPGPQPAPAALKTAGYTETIPAPPTTPPPAAATGYEAPSGTTTPTGVGSATWIPGVPNWATMLGGGVLATGLVLRAGGSR